MIQNIVFDFNGTLVDDLDVSIDALNECIKNLQGKGIFITV